jgi:hypothetical protein
MHASGLAIDKNDVEVALSARRRRFRFTDSAKKPVGGYAEQAGFQTEGNPKDDRNPCACHNCVTKDGVIESHNDERAGER